MEQDGHTPGSTSTSPKRRTPWGTLSARVISLVSRKGGVGKTTSAVNLGAAFALSGHSVLVVGVDPQCGVSRTLGYRLADLESGLLDVLENDRPLTHLAHPSPLKNLFFISPRLADLAEEDRYHAAMESAQDAFVAQVDRARNLYDTILIDCPPSLSSPTRAALQASDGFLVPVQAEELCRDSVGPLIGAVDAIREQDWGVPLAPHDDDGERRLDLEGIFLTMVSERTRACRQVSQLVADEFGPVLLAASVPRTTRLAEMALRGKPAVIYDRRSPGSRAYFDLADEVLERFRQRSGLAAPTPPAGERRPTAPPRASAAPASPLREHRGEVRTGSDDSDAAPESGPGGLDRLLNDLRARGALRHPTVALPGDYETPEMVSLDELLAEEGQDSDWDDAWGADGDRHDRLN